MTKPLIMNEKHRVILNGDEFAHSVIYNVLYPSSQGYQEFLEEFEILEKDFLASEDFYQGIEFTRVIKRKSDGKLFGYSYREAPGFDIELDIEMDNGEDHGLPTVYNDDITETLDGPFYVFLPVQEVTFKGYVISEGKEESITSFRGEHYFLSNFYVSAESRILLDGLNYPTSEHAYQAMKTRDPYIREKIAKLDTPGQAKRMGQIIALRDDWDEIKDKAMLKILREKFSHQNMAEKLLATGDAILEEGNYWGDTYWGVDQETGKGQNKLGKLLMKVRDELSAGSYLRGL